MFDRQFFQSKLGQAAIASVAAMIAVVAISPQLQAAPAHIEQAQCQRIDLA